MTVLRIHGTFGSYTATLTVTDIANILDAQISLSITLASISTKKFDRDAHLVSPDFFDADLFPKNYVHLNQG